MELREVLQVPAQIWIEVIMLTIAINIGIQP